MYVNNLNSFLGAGKYVSRHNRGCAIGILGVVYGVRDDTVDYLYLPVGGCRCTIAPIIKCRWAYLQLAEYAATDSAVGSVAPRQYV